MITYTHKHGLKHTQTDTHTHQNVDDFIWLLVIHRNPVHFPQHVAYMDQTWDRDKTGEREGGRERGRTRERGEQNREDTDTET